MIPAQSNKDMADWTMQGLHNVLPRFFGLGNFFGRLTICLLEDRVRIAMMFVFLRCLILSYLTILDIQQATCSTVVYACNHEINTMFRRFRSTLVVSTSMGCSVFGRLASARDAC
jgi:hypothetical protein